MHRIHTSGHAFVDEAGRQRILSGVSLVCKGNRRPDGTIDYIGPWQEEDFRALACWGFNVVRLGLIWDAVEPQPGLYDDAYLGWIGTMLDHCRRHGLYAYLDMHQDLFSSLFSDGAPAWATLTTEPFDKTELWSDAYLFSPAVQQAYDAFWANEAAPDGVGLLDHYAAMWEHIADRFAEHEAVLGFDFLNEPNPGSGSLEVFGTLMAALAELRNAAEGTSYTAEDMVAAFMDPAAKLAALQLLEDRTFYTTLCQMAQGPVEAFDRQVLDPFYNRLTVAVRRRTPRGIIFRENSYFSNLGIPCAARPVENEQGREPLQAYSPHGYDLVVDTDALALASNARVEVIFAAHRATQLALGVPVLVGEWGAFGHDPDVLDHADYLLRLFERYLWSHTYWLYHDSFATAPVLQVLHRTYPQAVAGELIEYRNDRAADTFHMRWRDMAAGAAPTEVYLHAEPSEITLAGDYALIGDRLLIPPTGGERELVISFTEEQ